MIQLPEPPCARRLTRRHQLGARLRLRQNMRAGLRYAAPVAQHPVYRRPGLRHPVPRHQSARAASSTSSAWPATFTLRH
ncbi:MAG: hypothetical protein OSA47_11675, partial [Novosphingopyxis baekryungensis]|nr:hypothetical protein [Novosphingopyxis baekryungensis]